MIFLLTLLMQWAHGATPDGALRKAVLEALDHPARVEVSQVSLSGPWKDGSSARLFQPGRPYGLVGFEGSGVTGTAQVRVFAKVAVAKSRLRDGDSFSGAVRFEERELSSLAGGGYHVDRESLEGLQARGPIAVGRVIGSAQTQAPVLIQAGQSVDLQVARGDLNVTARVTALQRGRLNEWIRVRNPSTRRVMQAKVVGEKQVAL